MIVDSDELERQPESGEPPRRREETEEADRPESLQHQGCRERQPWSSPGQGRKGSRSKTSDHAGGEVRSQNK